MKKISILLLICLLSINTSLHAKKYKKKKKTKQKAEQPPKNLVAKPKDGQITLSWSPAVYAKSVLAGYNIYRGTKSGQYDPKPIARVKGTMATYTDTSLQNGVEYFYVVNATLKVLPLFLHSDDTNEASATPGKKSLQPKNIIAAPKGKQIVVSWEAPKVDEDTIITSYKIYRTIKSKKYSKQPIATVDGSTCTYVDRKIKKEVPYFYVIKAVSENITSKPSEEATAMVEKEVIIPDPEKNPASLYRENAKTSKPSQFYLRTSNRNAQRTRQSFHGTSRRGQSTRPYQRRNKRK